MGNAAKQLGPVCWDYETEMKGEFDMKNETTVKWLKAAGIRALRTVAQSALAVIGSSAMFGDVNWLLVGSTAALAGVTCILTSIVTGLPEAGETKEKL